MNFFWGCTHSHTTFPLTPLRGVGSVQASGLRHGTYVVCLDCGKEFGYNWTEMRIGDPVPVAVINSGAALSPAHR
ncbi:MAG: hypothetical protein ABSH50_32335 [Bryobacteraceae bacterium]